MGPGGGRHRGGLALCWTGDSSRFLTGAVAGRRSSGRSGRRLLCHCHVGLGLGLKGLPRPLAEKIFHCLPGLAHPFHLLQGAGLCRSGYGIAYPSASGSCQKRKVVSRSNFYEMRSGISGDTYVSLSEPSVVVSAGCPIVKGVPRLNIFD